MAPTPTQRAWRERIETGIRVAEPFLNVVLAVGDRVSRFAGRNQPDTYVPARRLGGEAERARVGAGEEPA